MWISAGIVADSHLAEKYRNTNSLLMSTTGQL